MFELPCTLTPFLLSFETLSLYQTHLGELLTVRTFASRKVSLRASAVEYILIPRLLLSLSSRSASASVCV